MPRRDPMAPATRFWNCRRRGRNPSTPDAVLRSDGRTPSIAQSLGKNGEDWKSRRYFSARRITGRVGLRLAISLKPALANIEAVPNQSDIGSDGVFLSIG